MPCTTELVLEGLRAVLDAALVSRYGPDRRAYREDNYPEKLQAEQTPAIGIEEGEQRIVENGAVLEQDVTLYVKVMAGEYTAVAEATGDPAESAGSPRVMPLLNEVLALIDGVVVDGTDIWNGVPVLIIATGAREKARNEREAAAVYPLTLQYARLAAEALGTA